MTVLYVDVSHHDWSRRGGNLDWSKIRAATSGCMIARATYGDPFGWNRSSSHHLDFHRAARAAGFDLRGSYHNLTHGDAASIARQVDWLRREMDEAGATWAMADVERYPEMMSAGTYPRWSDVQRFRDAWYAKESRVMAWYLPKWVWERSDMGSPALGGLRGPLVSSRYPLSYTKDDPAGLYSRCGGNTGSGWSAYGGKSPAVWQFTSSALVPGTTDGADCNAFRGSYAELRTLLTANGDEDMDLTAANLDAIARHVWNWDLLNGDGEDPAYRVLNRAALLAGQDTADEAAIVAGILAQLSPAKIAAAIPATQAQAVADEIARRMNGGTVVTPR